MTRLDSVERAIADIAAGKAVVVIEAAGHPAALETSIALTGPGGRTITVGLPRPDARISPDDAVHAVGTSSFD